MNEMTTVIADVPRPAQIHFWGSQEAVSRRWSCEGDSIQTLRPAAVRMGAPMESPSRLAVQPLEYPKGASTAHGLEHEGTSTTRDPREDEPESPVDFALGDRSRFPMVIRSMSHPVSEPDAAERSDPSSKTIGAGEHSSASTVEPSRASLTEPDSRIGID